MTASVDRPAHITMLCALLNDAIALHDIALQIVIVKVSPEPFLACGFAFAAPFPCCVKSPPALARLAVAEPAIATTSAAASTAGVMLVTVVG